MPQLEFGDYAPQIFWLVVTFVVLMILMWRLALPGVRKVIDAREKHVADDLEQAEAFKAKAEDALKAYEDALREARSKAHGLMSESQAKHDAEAAKQRERLDAELAEKAAGAEKRIAETRAEALSSMRDIATEVARTTTARLIGVEPAADEAAKTVDSTMKGGA